MQYVFDKGKVHSCRIRTLYNNKEYMICSRVCSFLVMLCALGEVVMMYSYDFDKLYVLIGVLIITVVAMVKHFAMMYISNSIIDKIYEENNRGKLRIDDGELVYEFVSKKGIGLITDKRWEYRIFLRDIENFTLHNGYFSIRGRGIIKEMTNGTGVRCVREMSKFDMPDFFNVDMKDIIDKIKDVSNKQITTYC